MVICTSIKIKAVDQRLTVVQQPILASGDVGTVRVEYELDNFWDSYTPSGTFFTGKKPEEVYEQPLTDGACIVPWEALQEDGILYIGLRGVDGTGLVKTAAPVRYRVEKGSPRGDGTTVEPTPDVYQQLLLAAKNAETLAKATEASAKNAEDSAGHAAQLAGSIREDANAGVFTPQRGVDYWTEADIAEMKAYLDSVAEEGYTPQKGVDYWTLEDIAAIKAYVDDVILNGEW
jgi:hypothetical protein